MRARWIPLASPVVALALVPVGPAVADHDDEGSGHGMVEFANTCSSAEQPRFERAVAQLHSFGFEFARAGFEAVAPDDTHGEVVTYKPVLGHKPDWLQLQSMPPTVELAMTSTKISLEDLYSSHEVSRGTNKSDIRSGEMVSLLLEQDAFGKMLSHAVFEESLEAWGSRILKRMQDGYESERMIKIVGRDNEFEVIAFKGADLNGNTDVSVKRQSSLPDSRVLRNAEIMSRFEKGLYGDPMDPEVRRHVMNMDS